MRISGVYAFINGVALVASLYLVIVGIQNGNYPVASLLTFAVTVVSLSQSLGSLVESSSLLYDTLLFMQKYYQFLNKKDALTTPKMPQLCQTNHLQLNFAMFLLLTLKRITKPFYNTSILSLIPVQLWRLWAKTALVSPRWLSSYYAYTMFLRVRF